MALLLLFASVVLAQSPQEIGRRLILQSQRAALDGEVERATRMLEEGLEYPLPEPFVDSLLLDIGDILTDRQKKQLRSSDDRLTFLRRFWREADPTPATPENERYMEHYQRLAYARDHYPSAGPRGYDDRGMIYVRFGPPDEVFVQPSDNFFRGTESWLYHRLGNVSFDFIEFGATYELSSDFRRALVAVPFDLHDQIRIMRDFFAERSELGLAYSRIYDRFQDALDRERTGGQPLDLLMVNQVISEFVNDVENVHEKLPASATDVGREAKPLRFGFSFARFFDRQGNRLELYYGVPLHELKFETGEDGWLHSTLEIAFRILDPALNPVVQDRKIIPLRVRDRAALDTTDYVGQLTFFLQPDSYRVAVQMSNPESRKKQYFALRIPLTAYPSGRLDLSDLQFARRVISDTSHLERRAINGEAHGFLKREYFVEPYPYTLLTTDQAVELYYEVYNLATDKKGRSRYRIEYRIAGEKHSGGLGGLLKALNPFGQRSRTSITTTYRREASGDLQREVLKLDFGDLSPGNYMLRVTLTDELSEQHSVRVKRFRLLRGGK
ncbi:MAG: GWxTD domain-containing protein [candidate division KSB1 bacterium]|nr:GWxTD domain-containing protein [candidate division KSB1 bacterium]